MNGLEIRRKAFLLTLFLFFSLSSYFSFAQKTWGVVDLAVNFLREEPDYSAELGDQALMGTVVKILDKDGYWLKLQTPEPYTAWATDMGVVMMDSAQVHAYIEAPKYMVTAEYSNIFIDPDSRGERVSDLVCGDLLLKQLDKGGNPIKKKGFLAVSTPSGRKGWVKKSDLEDFVEWKNSRRPDAANIISTAKKFVGVSYQWGGTSIKGVDCSGLTRTVFLLNGILLPRNASQQARVGDEVDAGGLLRGDFSGLEPGDLLFFGNPVTRRVTHVGLYIGNGKMIHSSLLVRINSLTRGDEDYYENTDRFLWARRVIGRQDQDKGIISIGVSPYYFPGNGALSAQNAATPQRTT